jgi:hypothetical protein
MEIRMKRKVTSLKLNKGRQSRGAARTKFAPPQTVEEFFAMSGREQELWGDVGQIVTRVRQGATLAEACREFRRDPRTVQRLGKPALRKRRNGRWAAKKTDRLLRVLQIITPEGRQQIGILDSREASTLGKYWSAVDRYRDTGDASALKEFHGKHVTDADGIRIPLLTDLRELDRQGSAGNLSFESIYARVA